MEGKASDWRPGPTVCRCCLTEGCYKDISTEYFWMGKREVYAEMLSETLNLSVSFFWYIWSSILVWKASVRFDNASKFKSVLCVPCVAQCCDFRKWLVYKINRRWCIVGTDLNVKLPLHDGHSNGRHHRRIIHTTRWLCSFVVFRRADYMHHYPLLVPGKPTT